MNFKKSLLIGLPLAALFVIAASTPVLNGLLKGTLNGNGQSITNVLTYQGTNAELQNLHGTNGAFLWETNSQMSFGGGTNDNQGIASGLFGAVNRSNNYNLVTSPASLALISASGGSTSSQSNRVTGANGANLMLVSSTTLGTGSKVSQITGNGSILVNYANQSGDSTNTVSGNGSMLLSAIRSGETLLSGTASLLLAPSTIGTKNTLSGNGSLMIAGSSGSNIVSGGASLMIISGANATNAVTGSGSVLIGANITGQSMTASGSPSFVLGQGTAAWGGLAATAIDSFAFGGGFTNSVSNTFSVGFGSQFFNVRSNAATVGALDVAPSNTFRVYGSAASDFAFLSLTTQQTLPLTVGTYVQATNYQHAVGNGFNVSPVNVAGGSVTNTAAGWYKVAWKVDYSGGADIDHIEGTVFTNLVECTLVEGENDSAGAGLQVNNVHGHGILYLPANTRVDVRLQNIDDSDDVTLERVQLTVGHP